MLTHSVRNKQTGGDIYTFHEKYKLYTYATSKLNVVIATQQFQIVVENVFLVSLLPLEFG